MLMMEACGWSRGKTGIFRARPHSQNKGAQSQIGKINQAGVHLKPCVPVAIFLSELISSSRDCAWQNIESHSGIQQFDLRQIHQQYNRVTCFPLHI